MALSLTNIGSTLLLCLNWSPKQALLRFFVDYKLENRGARMLAAVLSRLTLVHVEELHCCDILKESIQLITDSSTLFFATLVVCKL